MSSATDGHSEWLGFSLKSISMILAGVVMLGLYIGVLLFGENSLMVLDNLDDYTQKITKQRRDLQNSNQRLQKEYFELLQLTE